MPHAVGARAAILRHHKTSLSIEQIEVGFPRATEVRVRLVGTGICHTDLAFRDGDGPAVPIPCVLGHEGAGVIEAVGEGVTDLVSGDHVVLSFGSCGACGSCLAGAPAYCFQMAVLNYGGGRSDGTSPLSQDGTRIGGGFFCQSSFATYAIAERRNTVEVPNDVPLALLGPLGCGIQTGAGAVLNVLKPKPGETLAIFGGGSVGLAALLGARAIETGAVIVIEPHPARRALALELGAMHAIDPTVGSVVDEIMSVSGGGVHAAIDTTGITAVIASAADVVRPRGALVILGMPPLDATLPINTMGLLARGMAVRGVVEGDADPQIFIPEMIRLWRAGRFPFDRLITRFPFERINEAIHAAETGAAIKPVLTFS
jgi:aryl-alcohol dehydrogenase/geraniol dehydrogenase (NAD+)